MCEHVHFRGSYTIVSLIRMTGGGGRSGWTFETTLALQRPVTRGQGSVTQQQEDAIIIVSVMLALPSDCTCPQAMYSEARDIPKYVY